MRTGRGHRKLTSSEFRSVGVLGPSLGAPTVLGSRYVDGLDYPSGTSRQAFPQPLLPSFDLKQAIDSKPIIQHGMKVNASSSTRWGDSGATVAPLTPYFTRDLIKLELPKVELTTVLNRIQDLCKEQSIQAHFEANPATLNLQTVDQIETRVKFWESVNGDNFYIDIQRYRGDPMQFTHLSNEILFSAKGNHQATTNTSTDMDVEQIRNIEAAIDRVAPPTHDDSVLKTLISAIDFIYHSISSSQFGERKAGLEALVFFSDLGRTSSSLACPISIVVLGGEGPQVTDQSQQEDINRKCAEIQTIIFRLVHDKDFKGDEALRKLLKESPAGMEPFMPPPYGTSTDYPPQYADAIGQYFNMGLSILATSLETLTCFARERGFDMGRISETFLLKSDTYDNLMGCVGFAEKRSSDAFLACKTIRLMATAFPGLRQKLAVDPEAKISLSKARKVGESSHALLLAEIQKLSKMVTVP